VDNTINTENNDDHDHKEHDHTELKTQEHNHAHELRILSRRRLWIALIINALFLVVEVIGGILANSLALLADAGHMLTDVAALILAIIVAGLAEKMATPTRTYGLLRAEVLGAFVNGAALIVIVGVIFWQAWSRFEQTIEINGPLMIIVAILGLAANAGSAWVLYSSRKETVNMKAAFLHMASDTLGSIGAIIAGLVILTTGWAPIDPIASVVIGILILWSSWGLLVQTINILLESTPENIDYHEVKEALESLEHVREVDDLHIWTISSGIPSLSAHVRLNATCSNTNHWQVCLKSAQNLLRERFGIIHTTLQFEPEDFVCDFERVCKLERNMD
jgi:cobalt-zinc-cadmium efflux system protein